MIHSWLFAALVAHATAGAPATPGDSTRTRHRMPSATPHAVRAVAPPVLDGRADDPIWRDAPVIDQFRVFEPTEDGDPAFRTEARLAYDDRHLYAVVRAYDPRPDSIVALLSRRDERTASDQIKLMVDSYHDRRTAYQFAVNPAGVKRDYYTYDDAKEDGSWDAVWDVATAIDSLGWVAEFRIPLSQLRFGDAPSHTFGVMIMRDVARLNERVSWPVFRRSRAGIPSQFAPVAGFDGIPTPRRLELMPYVVTKNVTEPGSPTFARRQEVTGGADVKWGVTSNLTLDATINPDFGQVEADPAVLNLTAFETYLRERRPFFLEGMGIFSLELGCDNGACNNVFYSRRIGRAPQLTAHAQALDAKAVAPAATTILGAGKLAGRLPGGTSVGLIHVVTQRETARGTFGELTVEPQTSYAVGRVQQDFRNGASGIGLMATSVRRQLDDFSAARLPEAAYAAGVDFRHRFLGQNYEVVGNVVASDVRGSAAAMDRLQRSSTHYFQRPDDMGAYDPTRTRLSGATGAVAFKKVAGGVLRYDLAVAGVSKGFDVNSVGFFPRDDQLIVSSWAALQFRTPRAFYRSLTINANAWDMHTTTDRLRIGGGVGGNVQLTFQNNWLLHFGSTGFSLWGTHCDRDCTRGGPALRRSPGISNFLYLQVDDRKAVSPHIVVNYGRGDDGEWNEWRFAPALDLRASSRFSATLGTAFSRRLYTGQWRANYTFARAGQSDTTQYTFAHIDRRDLGVTARLNYTASPTLSLQLYAQPFVASARYSDWKQLKSARAERFADRFEPFTPYAATTRDGTQVPSGPGGLGTRSFNSNAVLRWEYRPGSTLFLVWSQGRLDSRTGTDVDGRFQVDDAYDELFGLRPDNTVLVKFSYWFNP